MSPLPLALGAAGAVMVTASWLHYLASIPKETVPEHPVGHQAAMYGGMALSIGGLVMAGGPVAVALTAYSVGLGGFFRYLLGQAPLPDGEVVANVGDAFPAFEALDENGQPFSSAQLKGKRLLFKFFRGHW